jgi:hypothetical protein
MRHIGIVEITDEALLDLLQFRGGKILRISRDERMFQSLVSEIMIEHPEMPECAEGAVVSHVEPIYREPL